MKERRRCERCAAVESRHAIRRRAKEMSTSCTTRSVLLASCIDYNTAVVRVPSRSAVRQRKSEYICRTRNATLASQQRVRIAHYAHALRNVFELQRLSCLTHSQTTYGAFACFAKEEHDYQTFAFVVYIDPSSRE